MATPLPYDVSFQGKAPLANIAEIDYSIWNYRISWNASSTKPKARLGLTFSGKLDVKDSNDFPSVPTIQETQILRAPSGQSQFVFQKIHAKTVAQIDLAFVAPTAEDDFTAVQLCSGAEDSTTALLFRVKTGGPPGLTQTIQGPAVVCPTMTPSGTSPRLDNSSRRVQKSTLVSLQLSQSPPDVGRAVIKFAFARHIGLRPGEVAALGKAIDEPLKQLLTAFEGSPIPSQLPAPSHFAHISRSVLKSFGEEIVRHRRVLNETITKESIARHGRAAVEKDTAVATALNMLNAAIGAVNWLEANFKVTPIGMLNLERIEMTPVGVERGALIATIPLAPQEKTAVVHKEWSVTTKEFTTIVTDSLENYSETGVTENTELAQATQSQTSHSNQFNVNGTVTGSYGPVTATVSSGFTAQNQNSDSATESRKHAIATTRKASSRVKQEHKITISTTTVTGTSETSTRMLENPSLTNPIRIDYFSIMRKWHVGLYRYGLRLTYDIAIPEPAAAIRRTYAEIAELKKKLGPFVFTYKHSDIAAGNYLTIADLYGAQVPVFPATPPDVYQNANPPNTPAADAVTIFDMPPLNIPDGCWITNLFIQFHFESHTGPHEAKLSVLWSKFTQQAQQGDFGPVELTSAANGNFLFHAGGPCVVSLRLENTTNTWVGLRAIIAPTDAVVAQWQADVWSALFQAAQTQHYATQQEYQNQIAALEQKLNGVDTLTLRREENEQIMKGVLRWLLGPSFDFMPDDVRQLFKSQVNLDLDHGTAFDSGIGDGLNVSAAGWYPMFMYQEMVKFINEAIEWENVLYFLYSYFWDVPQAWEFVRQIQHPDATRQAFLRAGSARVVLTVRKGWEAAWVNFVEAGGFGSALIPGHPYLSIAGEIQAYDETNYPGIPPANAGGGPLPDSGGYVATQCRATVAPSASAVTLKVDSSEGFLEGYTAIIGDYSTGTTVGGSFVTAQETQKIVGIPDKTHITIERLEHAHDGSPKLFPVLQGGEKGQLIAEWFEYTPTSGTDIAVTSNLATIS